ncbi:hypothetical protein [Mycetocola saprophilus]|uniref:hypothetical protein n=1 Tax=Mycetocola saprophilus TaxID=76636 RepID=UPI003BF3E796
MGLNAQELNLQLPIEHVRSDYLQRELLISRGSGACSLAPPGLASMPGQCQPLRGPHAENADITLWSTSTSLTEAMFAAGADRSLTETVVGYAGVQDDAFTYRLSAWRFPEGITAADTPAWKILAACESSRVESFAGTNSVVLNEGTEPALVVSAQGTTVTLVESIRTVSEEGTELRYSETGSGLLPHEVMTKIQGWWFERAPAALLTPVSEDQTVGETLNHLPSTVTSASS